MLRILVRMLLVVFLAGVEWPAPPAGAQQAEQADQQQQAAEFERLWQRLQQIRDPDERISLAEEALKLEPNLQQWPLAMQREEARARLLWLLADGYRASARGDVRENLERSIATFDKALQIATRDKLPALWASLLNNLATAYRRRMHGDPADNQEKAIELHEAALTVRTRESDPQGWAQTTYNLGDTYFDRIRGEPSDNQERAIALFEAALAVRTREAAPQMWANIQYALGRLHKKRMRGVPGDNIETAIAYYEAALLVSTRETRPQVWAEIQNTLAATYLSRPRGNRIDNLEKAISHFEAALLVRTRESSPAGWRETLSNLGVAYRERIRGDKADNLEKAIGFLEAALAGTSRSTFPQEWATAAHGLANAYAVRLHGRKEDNVEKAIELFQAALSMFSSSASSLEWALTQSDLGVTYWRRIRGEKADNIEEAIKHLEAALSVFTRGAFLQHWAETQINISAVHYDRIRGSKADNLEKAIAHLEQALSVFDRSVNAHRWASIQNNLGFLHRNRIVGEPSSNLQTATVHYRAALSFRTRDHFPFEHLRAAQFLGQTFLELGHWTEADSAFATAREAFLLLFGQGLNDAQAGDLIYQAGPLFAEAAFASAQLGESEKALALATEGRARMMAVALKLQTLELPADKRRRLDELRTEIRIADRTVEATQGTERAAAGEKLASLRQELLALVKEADAGRGKASTALAQARNIAGKGGAVVVPIITNVGGKLLIVASKGVRSSGSDTSSRPRGGGAKPSRTSGGAKVSDPEGLTPSITVLDLPELTTHRLNALMRGDAKAGNKSGGWIGAYNINYLQGAELDKRWPQWLAAVGDLGPELWRLFGGKLDAALKAHGIKSGAQLVWLPSGALGILPLSLAQDPATKRRFADSYEIVYAPSLEALTSAQRQIAKATTATLAAIVNPTEDLAGTEKEGRLVASHFPDKARAVLAREAATPDAVLAALKGRTHWHFASHGTFSWADARQSALVMHDRARLTVGRLLEADGLGRPRLVVLSACETGLYDIDRNPDEFIGLPGTFTALGAAGVLGTLWPVSDAATALLMAKFYELHMGERLAPPTALRRAQLWLRQATNADLAAYAKLAAKQRRLETSHVAEIEHELSEDGLTRSRNSAAIEWIGSGAEDTSRKKRPGTAKRVARPYAHPYFWAGFIHTGL